MLSDTERRKAREVLAHYDLSHSNIEKISTGLINTTYRVHTDSGQRYILQLLNRMFPVEVNKNIDLVSRHLKDKGLTTPELIPTKDRALWLRQGRQTWRLLSYVDGDVHRRITRPEMAKEAGLLLGRVHVALFDFGGELAAPRPGGGHHLSHHLTVLSETLRERKDHPRHEEISALGGEILALSRSLPRLPATKARVVHGDPKIDNLIFRRNAHQARCLIDLDTIGKMPLYLELGDALRSWCNPGGEDTPDGSFSLELFAAAIKGYAAKTREHIEQDEWQSIVPATEAILLELAARFCADALNEDYFGWDAERFSSHSEHSSIRAAGQLRAARSLIAQRARAFDIVNAAFQG